MGKLIECYKGSGFREVRRRELGLLRPVVFTRSAGGSETFVKRLAPCGVLKGHRGCVNTVYFSPSGELLVSGSDDKQVIFWNWAVKSKRLSYHSGHSDNVFQARIMPFTNDRKVITSAADGQVRVGQISDDGGTLTKKLATHEGRAHKLAIEPGSPHIFYSCGEDGFVQHFDLRTTSATKLFQCSSSAESRRPVPLNAIVIDPRNPNYFSVGGLDEYARVYDIRNYRWDSTADTDCPVDKFSPRHLIRSGSINITGLAYSCKSELLVSYNDELIYLFPKNMEPGEEPQVFSGHRNSQTVKGVSFFGPNDEYVASGSDCGHVYVWKKRGGELVRVMVGDKNIVNCIEPHPHFPFMATSGLEKNIKIWTPTARKTTAALPSNMDEIMEQNKQGREDQSNSRITLSPDVIMHVLRLQRRRALAIIERRGSGNDDHRDDDGEDDDDDDDGFVLGFTGGDDPAGTEINPSGCSIC
ncbi:transducin/WD40 repeat-like superfamily protein [Wolffia australiana]